MKCTCDGTGFVPFVGDYTSARGRTYQNVSQTRRCPGYIDYFRSSPLMHDHPDKADVLQGSDLCSHAVATHRALRLKGEQTPKKKGLVL